MQLVHLIRPTALFAAVLMLLSGCGKSRDELYAEGKNAIGNGNPKGAIIFLRSALEKDNKFTDARFQLGNALAAVGSDGEAELEYKKVLEQEPSRGDVQLELIAVHIRMKKADQALQEGGAYLKSKPDDSRGLELMGIASLAKNLPNDAEKYLLRAVAADPNRHSVKLELAGFYRNRGNINEARRLALEVAENNKWNLQASVMLAELELMAGNREKALEIYLKAADKNRGATYPLYKAGQLYLESGNKGDALSTADRLVKQFPKSGDGNRLHGMILYRDRKYSEAITELTKSLQIQPAVETDYFLGLSYLNIQNYESALGQFRKTLTANPSFLQARFLTSTILLQQRQVDAAIAEAKTVLEAEPKHALAHNVLGSAYMLKGEFDDGMRELNRALELDPKIIDVHVKKGFYHLQKGNYRDAEAELLTAVRISPSLLNTRLILASYYISRRDYSRALSVLQEGINGKPTDAEIYNNMAAVYFVQNRLDDGYKTLLAAKKADPAFIYAYVNLAVYYSARDDYDKALDEYKAAISMAPGNPQALLGTAEIHELKGRDQEALEFYVKAANTKHEKAYLALAAYLMRTGRSAKALAALDTAIAALPKSSEALLMKGQIYLSQKEYKKALGIFKELEILKPEAGEMKRLETYLFMKDYGKAQEIAKNVSARKLKSADGNLLMAAVYEQQNDLPKALDELQKGEKIDPGNLEILVKRGTLLEKKSDFKGAAAAYSEALARNPDFIPAVLSQGVLQNITGDKAGAIRTFRAIMAKSKNYVPAINNLAFLLLDDPDKGNIQEGVRLAFTCFKLTPENPYVIDTLGYALIKSRRATEGVKLLEKAVALIPDNEEFKGHLALAKKNAASEAKDLPPGSASPVANAKPSSGAKPVLVEFKPKSKFQYEKLIVGVLIFVAMICFVSVIAYKITKPKPSNRKRKRRKGNAPA